MEAFDFVTSSFFWAPLIVGGILGLLLIALRNADKTPCPHCKAMIPKDATKCMHCTADIKQAPDGPLECPRCGAVAMKKKHWLWGEVNWCDTCEKQVYQK